MARLFLLVLAGLALPHSAAAATLHAAPAAPISAACSQVDPCELQTAVNLATEQPEASEVVLAAGDYQLENTLSSPGNVTIRGAAGTRPRLLGTMLTFAVLGGGALRDVEIVHDSSGGTALSVTNATVERVVVRALAEETLTVVLDDGAVLSSTAVSAPRAGSTALYVREESAGVVLRNVTARAAGVAFFHNGLASDATVVNTVLRGEVFDVQMNAGYQGTGPVVSVSHSAYRPDHVLLAEDAALQDTGGTVTADPLLASDGVHQQASSPTRNAGTAVADATDIDGEPRTQGPAPDIGADERAEPVAEPTAEPTQAPTATTSPTPSPTPTAVPDLTLPGLLSARFSSPPVAGKPANLVIEAFDPDSPLLGVVVDLGPGGITGHLACTTLKRRSPFVPGRRLKFTVPVLFTAPGLRSYTVEIRSGGCNGVPQSSRTEHSTQVGSGALTAFASKAPPSRCATSLRPRAGNERQLAAAVVCLVNRERKRRRLKPLKVSRKLVASATAHGNDMLESRYYDHQRPGGPTLKVRTRKARYRGASGENLGLGSGVLATPAQMMRAWMKSPLHRANILDRRYRAIGVHVTAKDPLARMIGAGLYTVNFGTKR